MRLKNTLEILEFSTANYTAYMETVEYHSFLWLWKMPYYRHLKKGIYESAWSDRITGDKVETIVQREIFNLLAVRFF